MYRILAAHREELSPGGGMRSLMGGWRSESGYVIALVQGRRAEQGANRRGGQGENR